MLRLEVSGKRPKGGPKREGGHEGVSEENAEEMRFSVL